MDSKDDSDDIFKQASIESAKKLIQKKNEEIKELTESQKESIIKRSVEILNEGETQWDLLKRMIDGSLTEKFIDIISNMPDRDFARNYLKLLEHFKPKITRQEGGQQEESDTTIYIQTVIVNEKGEKEIIDIEDIGRSKQIN